MWNGGWKVSFLVERPIKDPYIPSSICILYANAIIANLFASGVLVQKAPFWMVTFSQWPVQTVAPSPPGWCTHSLCSPPGTLAIFSPGAMFVQGVGVPTLVPFRTFLAGSLTHSAQNVYWRVVEICAHTHLQYFVTVTSVSSAPTAPRSRRPTRRNRCSSRERSGLRLSYSRNENWIVFYMEMFLYKKFTTYVIDRLFYIKVLKVICLY